MIKVSLAVLVTWASIAKGAFRITPKLLTDCASVSGTLPRVGSLCLVPKVPHSDTKCQSLSHSASTIPPWFPVSQPNFYRAESGRSSINKYSWISPAYWRYPCLKLTFKKDIAIASFYYHLSFSKEGFLFHSTLFLFIQSTFAGFFKNFSYHRLIF